MLLLAGALSLLVLIISFTVIFVALKLFSHFRAVHAQEDEEKQDNANGWVAGQLFELLSLLQTKSQKNGH